MKDLRFIRRSSAAAESFDRFDLLGHLETGDQWHRRIDRLGHRRNRDRCRVMFLAFPDLLDPD